MSQQLLTISQLAAYVGVTVRAVRHYHALGLLAEPIRDSSGYRRYGADAVIGLTRIKILADAGVPLSQIDTLMHASPDNFAAAIATIKSDIARRITELTSAEERLNALQSGDRMFVSEMVADYLDYMRHIGLSQTLVSLERDSWILLGAFHAKHVDEWVAQKKSLLQQPDISSLYLRLDEARDWPADDTRLKALARDIITISKRYTPSTVAGQDELTANTKALTLVDDYSTNTFPAWKALKTIIRELSEGQRNDISSAEDTPKG